MQPGEGLGAGRRGSRESGVGEDEGGRVALDVDDDGAGGRVVLAHRVVRAVGLLLLELLYLQLRAVSLVVDAGEDEYVEHEQRAADGDRHVEGGRVSGVS